MAAFEQVLAIPELLEHILLSMDMRTLLVSAQRVSRHWNSIINSSSSIQKALFFEPIVAQNPADLTTGRVKNPLLRKVFPSFYNTSLDHCVYPNVMFNSVIHGVTLSISPVVDNILERLPHTREQTMKKSLFFRQDASWRRMLVQQPAAPRIGIIRNSGLTQQSYDNAYVDAPANSGVTMGLLFATMYQLVGSRTAVGRVGVYWRIPSQDPKIHRYSWKCGDHETVLSKYGEDVAVVIRWNAGGQPYSSAEPALHVDELRRDGLPDGFECKDIVFKTIMAQDWFG